MSLFITSLNSGSNGNCYYIGNQQEAILIDAGLSCKETEKRMQQLGLSIKKVKAIFISHEHSDHIKGVRVIAQKHQLPVYVTGKTRQYGDLCLIESLGMPFLPHVPIIVGELVVTAFPKAHDAVEPHSFIIEHKGVTVGVFTDIGVPCDQLIHHFKQCHAAFLEANYDEHLLETGNYPYHLKQRIRGGKGHLSNAQALDLFITHRPPFLTHLLLSHLSRENNCPDLLDNLFRPHAGNTNVIIASRFMATDVFSIQKNAGSDHASSVAGIGRLPRLAQGVLF